MPSCQPDQPVQEGRSSTALGRERAVGFWLVVGWSLAGLVVAWGEWTGKGWANAIVHGWLGAGNSVSPLKYVFVYALGMTLMLPSCILTAWGAIAFGPLWGFVYAWLGGIAGASGAFLMGRLLGRRGLQALGGQRWARFDAALRRRGLFTVFMLRLSGAPLTHVSVWMGMTGMGFRSYLLGTGLGTAAGTLVFSWFVGAAWNAKDGMGSAGILPWLVMGGAAAALILKHRVGRRFLGRC